jgi:hypothetical protein
MCLGLSKNVAYPMHSLCYPNEGCPNCMSAEDAVLEKHIAGLYLRKDGSLIPFSRYPAFPSARIMILWMLALVIERITASFIRSLTIQPYGMEDKRDSG